MRFVRVGFLLVLLMLGAVNRVECSPPHAHDGGLSYSSAHFWSLSAIFYWAKRYGYRTEMLTLDVNAFRIPTRMAYQHILILGDRHGAPHADRMYRMLVDVKGIPERNIIQIEEFTWYAPGPSLGLVRMQVWSGYSLRIATRLLICYHERLLISVHGSELSVYHTPLVLLVIRFIRFHWLMRVISCLSFRVLIRIKYVMCLV